jgi:hypothetical protein
LRFRRWTLSIAAQRVEIDDIINDNSTLKPPIQVAVARTYRKALVAAARETYSDLEIFPKPYPSDYDAIVRRQFARSPSPPPKPRTARYALYMQ